MAKAVKFSQNAAKDIRKAVGIILNEPTDQTGKRPRRLSLGKPPIWYCKIAADYAGGSLTISATPCQEDGTLWPDAVAVNFDLSCHQTQLQCYGNLMAGDVVRYNPYNESQGGQLTAPPILATSQLYAVLQVTAVLSADGGRVGTDWVRAHG